MSDDSNVGEGLTLAVAIAACLCTLAAAVARIGALLRDDLIDGRQVVATIAALAGIALLSTFIDVGGSVAYLWSLDFAGTIVTAAALVTLIGAWLWRRKPNQVGLLLPFYLLGATLFVYPGFALLAIGLKSGALC